MPALAVALCMPVAASAGGQSAEAEKTPRTAQEIRRDRENADSLIRFGQPATAREILQTLCYDDGDDVACQNLGVMAMTGEGGVVDMAAGRAAFARGCDLQLPEACQNLADALVSGDGGPVEDVRALSLYLELCQRRYGGLGLEAKTISHAHIRRSHNKIDSLWGLPVGNFPVLV